MIQLFQHFYTLHSQGDTTEIVIFITIEFHFINPYELL